MIPSDDELSERLGEFRQTNGPTKRVITQTETYKFLWKIFEVHRSGQRVLRDDQILNLFWEVIPVDLSVDGVCAGVEEPNATWKLCPVNALRNHVFTERKFTDR
eukprot:CAMPEP_0201535132 /NCGR_PEP_ID=MMETSP0161_2-20130828/58146_1 /ASSEMBLY_ACC=CAM_ASM_000251 /TAXON_ID=180227 /ORGANISM="Neoparamoeba aestuarina, Strain SoJaBio B1-5/56/2" /LENGTH=103 /DNA_ID=CAMNT_0047940129 /DNA_START=280 /DNA_END=591 /DNA_ORIENTATION=+